MLNRQNNNGGGLTRSNETSLNHSFSWDLKPVLDVFRWPRYRFGYVDASVRLYMNLGCLLPDVGCRPSVCSTMLPRKTSPRSSVGRGTRMALPVCGTGSSVIKGSAMDSRGWTIIYSLGFIKHAKSPVCQTSSRVPYLGRRVNSTRCLIERKSPRLNNSFSRRKGRKEAVRQHFMRRQTPETSKV